MPACRTLILSLLLLLRAGAAAGGEVGTLLERHPLAPPDTSSPRATLASFLGVIAEFEQAFPAYRAAPSREGEARIFRLRARAVRTLDVSAIPPAALRERAGQAAYLLWEVLARIELPPLADVPDAAAFTDKAPARWRIPQTEITISRIAKGPRAGEFLFSADTVARIREFYEAVRHLPYLRPMPIGSPRLQAIEITGWLIPPAMVAALPAWSHVLIFSTPLWKLLAVLLVALLSLVALLLLHAVWPRSQRDSSPGAYLRSLLVPVGVLALTVWFRSFFLLQINLQGAVAEAVEMVLSITRSLSGACVAYLGAMFVAEAIIASPRIPDESLDAHLLRLTARIAGLIAATILIAYGARDLGIPVFGVIAGLGVGGLAVALAAQNTLGNLLGSLNLFADRPVRVGDFCQYGDKIGTIEQIGIRSTRIRGIDRTVTTMPNAEFAQMPVINYTRRDRMLFHKRLDLRYETTPDQLRLVMVKLREILLAHPQVSDDPAGVRLVDLAGSSIQIEIFAYVNTSNWNDFLAVQSDLLLRIIALVNELAGGFAFPSRTQYQPRDRRLDAEDAAAASAAIEALRTEHTLPLPEFGGEPRHGVENPPAAPLEGKSSR